MLSNLYFYNHILRLQLFFPSPNICAASLLELLFLLFICYFRLNKENSFYYILLKVFYWLGIIITEYMLITTYSRGGYVAFVISLFLGGCLQYRKKDSEVLKNSRGKFGRVVIQRFIQRNVFWIFLGIFIVMLFCIENGIQRANMIEKIHTDASIVLRLDLWRGAVGMIARYPLKPYEGNSSFLYTSWWQPLSYIAFTRSMVNDILSIWIRFGGLSSFVYLYLYLLSFFCGLKLMSSHSEHYNIIVSCLCLISSYYVSAFFSTLYFYSYLVIPVFLIELFLIIAYYHRRFIVHFRESSIFLACSLTCTLGLCLMIWGVGKLENHFYFNADWCQTSIVVNNDSISILDAIPKDRNSQYIVLLRGKFVEHPEIEVDFIRNIIRPLIDAGYSISIISDEVTPENFNIARQLVRLKQRNNDEVFLMCANNEGNVLTIFSKEGVHLPSEMDAREDSRFVGIFSSNNVKVLTVNFYIGPN